MKKITLIIIAVVYTLNTFSQVLNWDWAKRAGGANNDKAYSIVTDQSGNVYVSGTFYSPSITFGSYTLNNAGQTTTDDLFFVKYSPNGTVIWAKRAGGIGNEEAVSLAADNFGYIYMAGFSSSPSVTFGSNTLTGGGSFLIKYDTSGTVMWARSDTFNITTIAADRYGNVYAGGTFSVDSIIIGHNTLINAEINSPHEDILFVKYNTNGSVIWARCAGGMDNDFLNSIATDKHGNIYLAGAFTNSITFGATTYNTSGLGYRPFLAKYDTSGVVIWSKNTSGPSYAAPNSVASDTSGNVYLAGFYSGGSIIFDTSTLTNSFPTQQDIFFIKYSQSGTIKWAKTIGGGGNPTAYSIATDINGNIFMSGTLGSSPSIFGSDTLNNNGIFVAKYDSTGIALLGRGTSYAGNGTNSIAVASIDNIYLTGVFYNPTLSLFLDTLTNASPFTADIFVAKLDTTIRTVNNAGIQKLTNNTDIIISPNPFTSQTTISFSEAQKNTTIKIMDVVGKEIKTVLFSGKSLILEKGEMQSGVYFVQITDEKKNVVNKKIIVN